MDCAFAQNFSYHPANLFPLFVLISASIPFSARLNALCTGPCAHPTRPALPNSTPNPRHRTQLHQANYWLVPGCAPTRTHPHPNAPASSSTNSESILKAVDGFTAIMAACSIGTSRATRWRAEAGQTASERQVPKPGAAGMTRVWFEDGGGGVSG